MKNKINKYNKLFSKQYTEKETTNKQKKTKKKKHIMIFN